MTSTACRSSSSSHSRSLLRSSARRSSRSFLVISQNALILSWARRQQGPRGRVWNVEVMMVFCCYRRPSRLQPRARCAARRSVRTLQPTCTAHARPAPAHRTPAPAACSCGTPPPCSSRAPALRPGTCRMARVGRMAPMRRMARKRGHARSCAHATPGTSGGERTQRQRVEVRGPSQASAALRGAQREPGPGGRRAHLLGQLLQRGALDVGSRTRRCRRAAAILAGGLLLLLVLRERLCMIACVRIACVMRALAAACQRRHGPAALSQHGSTQRNVACAAVMAVRAAAQVSVCSLPYCCAWI